MVSYQLKGERSKQPTDISFILYHHKSMGEETLLETIQSYKNQRRIVPQLTMEIIVLLDSIQLEALGRIESIEQTEGVKLLFVETTESFVGPGVMWNYGMTAASGKRISFTWTGALWYPDSYIHLNRLLDQNYAEASFGPTVYLGKGKEEQWRLSEPSYEGIKITLSYMLIRREAVQRLGGFMEDIASIDVVDWEYTTRLMALCKIAALKGATVGVRHSLRELAQSETTTTEKIRSYFVHEKNLQMTTHHKGEQSNTTFIIYHYKTMEEDDLIETIESYRKSKSIGPWDQIEIIVMLDGISIKKMPLLEHFTLKNMTNLLIVENTGEMLGPGRLWNEGMKLAQGAYLVFTWTGVFWYPDSLVHLRRLAMQKDVAAGYGVVMYEARHKKESYTPDLVGRGQMACELMSFINAICLGYMVVKKEVVEEIGGFSNEIELARVADWQFIKKLLINHKIEPLLGRTVCARIPLGDIDYDYNFTYTVDQWIRQFKWSKYKIAIVSGITENAQVQLCIRNYLEEMRNTDLITSRRFIESDLIAEELKDYDYVFFVRCRTLGALQAAKYCLENHIKTAYLLDDNWFCATDTYPQLEGQIGKNSIPFFFFKLLISTVDTVFVTNDLIGEDMKQYANHIVKMPLNVRTADFRRQQTTEPRTTVHIGFAGSNSKIQHFSEAFKALERIMKDYSQVRLYFKGIELPSSLKMFGDRVVQSQYTFDYKAYAQEVSSWQYDIVISPLDDTRYINSKCPNKYLESTAMGAVGIYTAIPLYEVVIQDGVNGLLVNNKEDEWYMAIARLIQDPQLRAQLFAYAKQDIATHYETQVVLPTFKKLIMEALEGGEES